MASSALPTYSVNSPCSWEKGTWHRRQEENRKHTLPYPPLLHESGAIYAVQQQHIMHVRRCALYFRGILELAHAYYLKLKAPNTKDWSPMLNIVHVFLNANTSVVQMFWLTCMFSSSRTGDFLGKIWLAWTHSRVCWPSSSCRATSRVRQNRHNEQHSQFSV